jgi:glycosyltransferase involved in cell wall biosynthesis
MTASVLMVLPPREKFSPDHAGAISIVVHCLALATPNAVVLGRAVGGGAFGDVAFRAVAKPAGSQWGYIWAVIRAVRKLRPASVDVHQHPNLAGILARLFPGIKIILVLHNNPLTMHGLISVRQRRAALRRLHRIVTVSDDLRSRYMSGLGAEAKTPVTLNNPVDFERLPARGASRRQEFLFVGRITPEKGVDVFVRACARVLPRLPGWSARIIGGERYGLHQREAQFTTDIRGAAAEAGVLYTGYIPQSEVLQAMAEAAILVMPSRMIEGFPLTAIEGMACGLALVATRQGGLPEAAGEAAWYVAAGDDEALADAMLKLAADPLARDRLTQLGWERVQRLERSVVAARWNAMRQEQT